MPSTPSLCRFLQEISMNLEIPVEVTTTAFIFLHSVVKEVSLTSLGSESIALAMGCLILAIKVKETPVRINEVLDVAVKLTSGTPTLSVEKFADRKKILREKSGFFESMILRIFDGPLEPEIGFPFLHTLVENQQHSKIAVKLLADFYRSPLALSMKPHELAEGAVFFCRKILKETADPIPEWLGKIVEDVYT